MAHVVPRESPAPPVVPPGSHEEREAFRRLQARLAATFRELFPDPGAARTVVVVPSLSFDQEVMAKIAGVLHYEERLLCLLLLLRLPCTRLIYVTSGPIAESTIDYYLQLLPGIPHQHARRRLDLFCCHDASLQPLSAKVLARPRLLARIREAIRDPRTAHLTCFTVSALERTLAVRLGVPIYGCDPDLLDLGSKSGGRKVFREAGVAVPAGVEDLRDERDVAEALAALKARDPNLRRAVVKLNEGFSGEGNAVFRFDDDGAPEGGALSGWVRARLPSLAFEARDMAWELYRAKLRSMGGVVEAFVEGAEKRSPSAQYRVDPLGRVEVISTHDQVLGGPSGQTFLGCQFPADHAYRLEVQAAGLRAAAILRDRGVLGRFGVDFLAVREGDRWKHYGIGDRRTHPAGHGARRRDHRPRQALPRRPPAGPGRHPAGEPARAPDPGAAHGRGRRRPGDHRRGRADQAGAEAHRGVLEPPDRQWPGRGGDPVARPPEAAGGGVRQPLTDPRLAGQERALGHQVERGGGGREHAGQGGRDRRRRVRTGRPPL